MIAMWYTMYSMWQKMLHEVHEIRYMTSETLRHDVGHVMYDVWIGATVCMVHVIQHTYVHIGCT